MRGESYKESYSFKSRDRGICFIIVDALLLVIALCNQSRFIPNDNTRVVELVSKDPSSANNGLVCRAWNKSPDFISLELLYFLLHRHYPVRVNNGVFDVPGFSQGNKSIEGKKVKR